MCTIEERVQLMVEQHPQKMAVISGGVAVSYAEFWARVQEKASLFLSQKMVSEGRGHVIRASQSIDFLVTYFAVHLAGGVAVPLENDIPEERLVSIKGEVEHLAIPLGTADVLYTTGTTGQSKGVMISHEAVIANTENLVEAQGYSEGLLFVITGPLNHIGNLSKVLPVLFTGGTLYIMQGMKDMNLFFSAFELPFARVATFLVPASIRMLMAFCSDRLQACASRIEFIETGAAPIAQSDMEHLCKLLPSSRLYNTYASTETGIVCTHNFNGDKCIAGCLGRPMKHSRVFIDETGAVACQGKTLMTGYIGDSVATRSLLRDGTLYTHDNGLLDEDGMLRLTGRCDDVINIGGFKVAPSEVEDVALSLPEVVDCVCISTIHPVLGNVLKLLLVLEEGCVLDKKRIARYIRTKLEVYKVPTLYETVEKINRTYNGKINRKYYR